MNEHINCSNSVGAGGLTTGGEQLCVSVPSRCNHLSTAWLSPSLAPVAGDVPRGMDASTVLIQSALEGSQSEVGDSVYLSQVAVTTFPLQAPPASGRSFHGCLYTVPVPSRDRRSMCHTEFELRTVICNVLLQPDHCFLQLSN